MLGELLGLLVPLLRGAEPEVQGIFVAWLHKWRVEIESQCPGIVQEIQNEIASHSDERVSQLLHRLRREATGQPPE